jgi:hypothetical protein
VPCKKRRREANMTPNRAYGRHIRKRGLESSFSGMSCASTTKRYDDTLIGSYPRPSDAHSTRSFARPHRRRTAVVQLAGRIRFCPDCAVLSERPRAAVQAAVRARKNAEPKSEFGLPEQRKYPMPDASHARNAKARASQMEHQGKLSAADKKKIDAKADRILKK